MPKKSSSGSKKKSSSDAYKSGDGGSKHSDGGSKHSKSGEKGKHTRRHSVEGVGKHTRRHSAEGGEKAKHSKSSEKSKPKVKIQTGEEKAIWYQDRGKKSAKEIQSSRDLHLAGKFPAMAGRWAMGEYTNQKGHNFLLLAHTGGVQVASKERNAGDFFWRSPTEPRRKKGEEPGGIQVQPTGHRTVSSARTKMMPEVVDFDRLIQAATEAGADLFKLQTDRVYKYGRFGFWLVELFANGDVCITNSNSSVKGTEYVVKVERVGALRFTDTTGIDHNLADQDEIERVAKQKSKSANQQDAMKARAARKQADAAKKQTGAKKLNSLKPGTSLDEGDLEEWMCQVCMTRGNRADKCRTCQRPQGADGTEMGLGKQARARESAEAKRLMGEAEFRNQISAWKEMAEASLKEATKAEIGKMNKMLRRFPWEPDRGTGYRAVELLTQLELCRQVEEKLESSIVARETAEAEMKFFAFVLSAKRLKRTRKKPRKRKFKAKIDRMVRRVERVREFKEEAKKRKEAGLKELSKGVKLVLCLVPCLKFIGVGRIKKTKVVSVEEELMTMDIHDK